MPVRTDGDYMIPFRYDEYMESRKWSSEIPFIEFPSEWKIKIVPPFAGAVVRFQVILPGMKDSERVSIYLDCYDNLGWNGSPYWEVYPYKNDVGRCEMNDVKTLLEMIADRDTGGERSGG